MKCKDLYIFLGHEIHIVHDLINILSKPYLEILLARIFVITFNTLLYKRDAKKDITIQWIIQRMNIKIRKKRLIKHSRIS